MNSPIFGHQFAWRSAVLFLVLLAAICPAWCQDEETPEEPAVAPMVAAHPLIDFATVPIAPESKRFAILSIPLSVNDCTPKPIIRQQHLRKISCIIENRGGLDLNDFKPLTKDEKSGLALFAESQDVPEFFNYVEGDTTSDIPLILKKAPEVVQMATGFMVTFEPVAVGGWTQIPIDADAFPDFYIVGRTSIEMRHGDGFEAYMHPGMITIEDRDPSIGTFKRFDLPFPSPEFGENLSTCLGFATLKEYSDPAIFQCDIVQLYNYTKIGQRLPNRSEPTTIMAMDLIGAPSEEYFIREIRVNFIAVDMYPMSWLWDTQFGTSVAGDVSGFGSVHSLSGKSSSGFIQFDYLNSRVPKFLQNPQLYETFPPPLSNPNEFGLSVFDRANPRRARFLADRARDRARTPTPDVLLGLLKDEPGGIFVFADGDGGTPGVYESTVDRLLVLDDGVRFENLDVNTIPPDIINRLLPTELLKSKFSLMPTDPITGEVDLSFLTRDEPLDWLFLPGLAMLLEMYGGFEAPDGLKIDETFVENYRVAPRDFTWDSGKYWLGLSRELIDFLLEDAALEAADEDGDGIPDVILADYSRNHFLILETDRRRGRGFAFDLRRIIFPRDTYPDEEAEVSLFVDDLDSEGLLDFFTVSRRHNQIRLVFPSPGGKAKTRTVFLPSLSHALDREGVGWFGKAVWYGDTDGDGAKELLVVTNQPLDPSFDLSSVSRASPDEAIRSILRPEAEKTSFAPYFRLLIYRIKGEKISLAGKLNTFVASRGMRPERIVFRGRDVSPVPRIIIEFANRKTGRAIQATFAIAKRPAARR